MDSSQWRAKTPGTCAHAHRLAGASDRRQRNSSRKLHMRIWRREFHKRSVRSVRHKRERTTEDKDAWYNHQKRWISCSNSRGVNQKEMVKGLLMLNPGLFRLIHFSSIHYPSNSSVSADSQTKSQNGNKESRRCSTPRKTQRCESIAKLHAHKYKQSARRRTSHSQSAKQLSPLLYEETHTFSHTLNTKHR